MTMALDGLFATAMSLHMFPQLTLGRLPKVQKVYMGGSQTKTPIESLHSLWLFATAMSLDMCFLW